MALQTISMPSALYTDCQIVQKGARKGLKWAKDSTRRYSRLWTALHYDLDEGEQANMVHWIPAHSAQDQPGRLICSDGTALAETIRCANEIIVAETIALSAGMRATLRPASSLCLWGGSPM